MSAIEIIFFLLTIINKRFHFSDACRLSERQSVDVQIYF